MKMIEMKDSLELRTDIYKNILSLSQAQNSGRCVLEDNDLLT